MLRPLLLAAGLGLSMLGGAFVGAIAFQPSMSHGPEENVVALVQGAVIGALAGGMAWKIYWAKRLRQRTL